MFPVSQHSIVSGVDHKDIGSTLLRKEDGEWGSKTAVGSRLFSGPLRSDVLALQDKLEQKAVSVKILSIGLFDANGEKTSVTLMDITNINRTTKKTESYLSKTLYLVGK